MVGPKKKTVCPLEWRSLAIRSVGVRWPVRGWHRNKMKGPFLPVSFNVGAVAIALDWFLVCIRPGLRAPRDDGWMLRGRGRKCKRETEVEKYFICYVVR